jgi:hypothetical protein
MRKKISLEQWERIEYALMKAEISYKVSFDSHAVMDGAVYDKMIDVEPFTVVRFDETSE